MKSRAAVAFGPGQPLQILPDKSLGTVLMLFYLNNINSLIKRSRKHYRLKIPSKP